MARAGIWYMRVSKIHNLNGTYTVNMKEATAHVPPFSTVYSLIATSVFVFVLGDPRSETVDMKCGPNKQDNQTIYTQNFLATMDRISDQLSSGAIFAAASSGSGPNANYALFQCYGDLSRVDCALCHLQARTVLPACAPASNGGKIFLDGCFMRVETYNFFAEWAGTEDKAVCGGNRTRETTTAAAFGGAARRAVGRSAAAAAKGDGYARAEERAKDSNVSAFALANCWKTLNKSSCRACLETASASELGCLPGSEGRALKTGCFLRYSDVNFLNPEQETKSSRGKTLIAVVAVAISCTVVLIAGAAAVVVYKRRKRKLQKKRKGLIDVKKLAQILNDSGLNFEFSTLQKATGSFSDAHKLGEGGFGTVYKGVLADGREVAVKRLFFNSMHRAEEFYNEVNIISSVEHKNLVRLLGCSFSGTDSLLVYEFMANESLDRHIFDSNKGKALNWEMRYGIIKGTAEGLIHLHENHKNRILHRDIKASNILLDFRFRAKIADFGLAKSFQDGKSHVSTAIAGTIGYMAPEYLAHGRLSEKVDVYSFGVLLLEIATGRQNNDGDKSSDSLDSLVITVWKNLQRGTVEELFDPNLMSDNYNNIKDEVLRVVHVGLLCTQENPALRPTMSKALQMLKNKEESLPAPSNPPFLDVQTMEFHDHSSEDPSAPLNSTCHSTPASYPLQ